MTNPPNVPTPAPQRSGMPKWLVILLVIFLVLAVGCCGGVATCTYFAGRGIDKVGTAIQKGIDERKKRDAESGTGSSENEPLRRVAIPSSFPSDVPQPKNLVPISAVSDNMSGATVVTFAGDVARSDVVDFFERELPKNGWTKSTDFEMNEMKTLDYAKGDRRVTIVISSDHSRTHAIVTCSKK